MDGYSLSKQWFDWCSENPEKVKPNHAALYYWIVEKCNRMSWKQKFGLPTDQAMGLIGIKSYNTYIQTLKDLVEWGFISMVEKSKNQYTANIIALSENDKAHDKAIATHIAKQHESTSESTDSINKLLNNKPLKEENKESRPTVFDFKSNLLSYGFELSLVSDWLNVRKTKKASNTQTAFEGFIKEVEKTSLEKNELLRICIEKSWSGFKADWLQNLNKNFTNGSNQTKPAEFTNQRTNSREAGATTILNRLGREPVFEGTN